MWQNVFEIYWQPDFRWEKYRNMGWHSHLDLAENSEKTGSSFEGNWWDLHYKWFLWGLEFKQGALPQNYLAYTCWEMPWLTEVDRCTPKRLHSGYVLFLKASTLFPRGTTTWADQSPCVRYAPISAGLFIICVPECVIKRQTSALAFLQYANPLSLNHFCVSDNSYNSFFGVFFSLVSPYSVSLRVLELCWLSKKAYFYSINEVYTSVRWFWL